MDKLRVISVAIIFVLGFIQNFSFAQLPFVESFTNSTAPGFVFGGNPVSAFLTAPSLDPEGQGVLRLTNNTNNQAGFVYNTGIVLPSSGLNIKFEYFTYGGNGADGIVFFLFDAEADPFQIGGYGGSLGYAQRSGGVPGVSRAYLGIGLDEFGNFSNPIEGRQGGPGRRSQSVTLRGAGNGSATIPSNYPYLTHVQVSQPPFNFNIDVPGPTRTTDSTDARYRRVEITLKPREPSGYFIDMVIVTGGTPPVRNQILQDFAYTTPAPPALRLGFSAGTGGSRNFHEIRNLEVTAYDIHNLEPPQTNNISSVTCTNTPIIINILNSVTVFGDPANFANLNSIDLDPLTPGQQTSITIPGEGTFLYNSFLQRLEFTPAEGFQGLSSIQYTIRDAFGVLSNIANITVEVSDEFCLDCFISEGYNNIIGLVYNDLNANGNLNSNEPGLENIEIELYEDVNGNGILDAGDILLETTLTDEDGRLLFSVEPTVATNNVRDEFSNNNASGNNGTVNWSGPWVTSGNVSFSSNQMRIRGNPSQATRSADLSGAISANLSLDYLGVGPGSNTPNVEVLISTNPSGQYTTLLVITTKTPLSFTQDITPFISPTTTIRFRQLSENNNTGVNIENVDITFESPVSSNYIVRLGSPLPGNFFLTSSPDAYAISFTGVNEADCDNIFGIAELFSSIVLQKNLQNINGNVAQTTFNAVGDVLNFSITLQNNGNIALRDILVTDPGADGPPSYVSGDINFNNRLDVGETWIYSAQYTITQADLDAGFYTNIATVTAFDNLDQEVSDSGTSTVFAEQDPAIRVSKTADPLTCTDPGNIIDYTIFVENTGNVTLNNVEVTDPLTGLNTTILSLAPGASITFLESYTILQADVDAGQVVNTVTATVDFAGTEITDSSVLTIPVQELICEITGNGVRFVPVKLLNILVRKEWFLIPGVYRAMPQ